MLFQRLGGGRTDGTDEGGIERFFYLLFDSFLLCNAEEIHHLHRSGEQRHVDPSGGQTPGRLMQRAGIFRQIPAIDSNGCHGFTQIRQARDQILVGSPVLLQDDSGFGPVPHGDQDLPPGIWFGYQYAGCKADFAQCGGRLGSTHHDGELAQGAFQLRLTVTCEQRLPKHFCADAGEQDHAIELAGDQIAGERECFFLLLEGDFAHGGRDERVATLFADQRGHLFRTAALERKHAETVKGHSLIVGTVSTSSSLREINGQQWLALFAAQAGYMLDAMDVLLFVFAVNAIAHDFGLSSLQAGLVSSSTLAFSSIGGIVFGILSDRVGRARCLVWSILIYSFASAGSASSTGLLSLLCWRALIGVGLGGEWSAGAVLVAETWPAEHRAKAVGIMQSGWALGYMAAAGLSAWILPRWGWKVLFLSGVFPAFGTLALRRKLHEPEIWRQARRSVARPRVRQLFEGELLSRTLLGTALATAVLFAYWGLFTWIPGFLSASRERGGAGLDIVHTSEFVVPMQLGAFAGYVSFGWLADKIGRRPAFVSYVVGAALVTPIYGASRSPQVLLLLGPAVGFLGTGFFSLFGAMLAELYPTAVRGAAAGVVYNIGRGLSSLAPFTVGFFADRYGIGASLALNSAFFLLGAALIFTLPETKQAELV